MYKSIPTNIIFNLFDLLKYGTFFMFVLQISNLSILTNKKSFYLIFLFGSVYNLLLKLILLLTCSFKVYKF